MYRFHANTPPDSIPQLFSYAEDLADRMRQIAGQTGYGQLAGAATLAFLLREGLAELMRERAA